MPRKTRGRKLIKKLGKPSKSLGRLAKSVKSSAKKPFFGGLTTQIAKGFRALRDVAKKRRVSVSDKRQRLASIGIKPYKSKGMSAKQKKKITSLYSNFNEFFYSRGNARAHTVVHTKSKETLRLAKKSGLAVYENRIYVPVSYAGAKVAAGTFLNEKIIIRHNYNKVEHIFLGGGETFDRVVGKLRNYELEKNEFITGSFFGGPVWNRMVVKIDSLLNYLDNVFVPHMPSHMVPTKRNIARYKANLIKNLALVEVNFGNFDNPELPDTVMDEENEKRIKLRRRRA